MTHQVKFIRCAVAGMEAVEVHTRQSFPRHAHDQYGIGVMHRGAHRSWSGRGQVEAESGDVITCNPGEMHDGASVGDAPRAWRMLYFESSLTSDIAEDMSDGRVRSVEFNAPVVRDRRVAVWFQRLFAGATTPACETSELQTEGLFLALLASAMGNQSATERAPAVPPSIAAALQCIDDDPAASVTLSDLGRECRLSRFQLLRGFVHTLGLTPHAYQVQRRAALARRLIRQGERLADVALASGFADQSHMTRTFARIYGYSPGAYARALK